MSGWINLERSSPISRHLQSLCMEAKDSTYVRDVDIKLWAELPGEHFKMKNYLLSVKHERSAQLQL
jgi:hypothetical protein